MKSSDDRPIEELKNLGPKSAAALRAIGITTVGALRTIGPVEAFVMLRQHGRNVNRVMLWAMAMGLEDRHWQDVTPREKRDLTAGLQ